MFYKEGEPIRCTAAVAYSINKQLVLEQIIVDPPQEHEVRVKVTNTALCRTDLFTLKGLNPEGKFPCVLGHEGSGIVESCGSKVETVKKGDHVLLLYIPECGHCADCKSEKSNLCSVIKATQAQGVMPQGSSRLHNLENETLWHFMGCSSFSQYTVVSDISCVKIRDDAPLDKICLLGCGVTTGFGAPIAKGVKAGDRVAVFGSGTVGLSVVQSCSQLKCSQVVVVDVQDNKREWALGFGATDFINPQKIPKNKSLLQTLIDKSGGDGFDFTFDCTGSTSVMRTALESCRKGWGTSVIIGLAGAGKEISTLPYNLIVGRSWEGCAFGGVKGRSELPTLVERYMNNEIKLDEYITNKRPLKEINEALKELEDGLVLKTVLDTGDGSRSRM